MLRGFNEKYALHDTRRNSKGKKEKGQKKPTTKTLHIV